MGTNFLYTKTCQIEVDEPTGWVHIRINRGHKLVGVRADVKGKHASETQHLTWDLARFVETDEGLFHVGLHIEEKVDGKKEG